MSPDGGTGRRDGLKIRFSLGEWEFDPPSGHQEIGVKLYMGIVLSEKTMNWAIEWPILD